ncbi:MAG: alpha/beta hydrolase [Eubacteriales bacterium]|nr:alpha/beta hydrolase [Eubacteriales bacterium]
MDLEIRKRSGRSKSKVILAVVVALLAIAFLAVAIYFGNYYHADKDAAEGLKSTETVTVREGDDSILFDGPGEEEALIFYPGAKVEAGAYARLLHRISDQGIDCILVKMPLNFAIFGKNSGDEVMKDYSYDDWYISGHSLGGAAASMNLADHVEDGNMPYNGIIFFGSYPASSIKRSGVSALTVYVTRDMGLDKIQENMKNLPAGYEKYVINGGNHAQFGDYGQQKGDNEAEISAEKQQEMAADRVVEFIKEQDK